MSRIEAQPAVPAPPVDWYRVGDGSLGIRAMSGAFRQGFRDIYGECAEAAPAAPAHARVVCDVRSLAEDGFARVTFEDPEPLSLIDFALTLFGERGFRESASSVPGWRFVVSTLPARDDTFAFADGCVLVDGRQAWQGLIANCAIHRTLRLQRDVLFLHAASVAIHGRGILLVGAKGAGKTTLALTLAARGHEFLGDEIAAVRLETRQLLPVRRAVSIREGPADPVVREAVAARGISPRVFPDGSTRVRAQVGTLLPQAGGGEAPLHAVLFLRGMGQAARAEAVPAGPDLLRRLTPLASSLWGMQPGARAVRLMRLFGGTRCYLLDAGPPAETADVITQVVEEIG